MPISEARHRANEKWNAKAYDEIKVRVSKGTKELWQSAAQQAGLSLNAYITEAVEAKRAGDGFGFDGEKGDPKG